MAASLLSSSVIAAPPKEVAAFTEDHCASCHDAKEKKGGLDLDVLDFRFDTPAARAEWVKIIDRLSADEMPPPKKPRPEQEKKDASCARSATA